MKVAFDATPLLDVRTGIGAFAEELLRRLGSTPTVDVVAFGYTRIYLEDLRSRLPTGVGSTRRAIPARPTRKLWTHTDHPSIETWTGRIDLVHGPNYVVPPSRSGASLVSVHDLTCVRFPELCDANTRQYPRLIERAIRRGSHVHCDSEFVAAEVRDHFDVAPERVHVVNLGVTTARHGDAAAGQAHVASSRYILALGTIEPRKNLPVLVEAFDRLAAEDPQLALVVAGKLGWGAESYRAAVERARHADRIRTLGFVSDDRRADLLAGAALLAYPSRYEGFGLPPLEAMSVGVPVVATTAGSLPEVLGDGAVLVEPDDCDALEHALRDVLTDADVRRTLRAAGLQRVGAFSWDRCADEMIGLYGRIVEDESA